MPQTTIVLPCFNEEQRLDRRAFGRFLATARSCRLLFVNDGSRDGTLSVLREIEAQHAGAVDVLDLPRNVGKAEAVRTGVQYALAHGADYVGYWDADLATPLDVVEDFVRVLDRRRGVDVVLGCRLPLLGRQVQRRPARARLGRLFATAASRMLGVPVRDTQCGAKLFRATPWVAAVFTRPFCARWIFDVEILARLVKLARTAGAPAPADCLYELPLDNWREVPGSKLRGRDFLKAPWELAGIYWRRLGPFSEALPAIATPPRMRIPLSAPLVEGAAPASAPVLGTAAPAESVPASAAEEVRRAA